LDLIECERNNCECENKPHIYFRERECNKIAESNNNRCVIKTKFEIGEKQLLGFVKGYTNIDGMDEGHHKHRIKGKKRDTQPQTLTNTYQKRGTQRTPKHKRDGTWVRSKRGSIGGRGEWRRSCHLGITPR